MKEWTGRVCKIEIKKDISLFYTAMIVYADDKIISFVDREGKNYVFNNNDIEQISEMEEIKWEFLKRKNNQQKQIQT